MVSSSRPESRAGDVPTSEEREREKERRERVEELREFCEEIMQRSVLGSFDCVKDCSPI